MTYDSKSLTAEPVPKLSELEKLERVVREGWEGFRRAALALLEIRDRKLYQAAGYQDFKSYCEGRELGGKSHCYRLIDAARIIGRIEKQPPVSPKGDAVIPVGERQVRPLNEIKDPDTQVAVWVQAVAEAEGQPTAKQVQDVVDSVKGKLSPEGVAMLTREEIAAERAAQKAREKRDQVTAESERVVRGREHVRLGMRQFVLVDGAEEVVRLCKAALKAAESL